MGHTPFGYEINNGVAVIKDSEAVKIRNLYSNYLSGLSLTAAATNAGIASTHGGVKRMLENRRYLGDDFYPAIIDEDTYNKAMNELVLRATKLGRVNRASKVIPVFIPTNFTLNTIKEHYDDPMKQAEYLYSLIESKVD